MSTRCAWVSVGHLGVDLDLAAEPRARCQPPSAPPERDPAVAGRAEVVHERAGVGDALAAGPAQMPRARRAPARSGRCARTSPTAGSAAAPRRASRRSSPARRRPRGRARCAVSAVTPSGATRNAVTRERSRITSRSRSRRPSASRAGWTVASSATSSPRRNRGESQRARTSPALSARTRSGGDAATISSRMASWAGAVDAITKPPGVNQASTPCSEHQRPIECTLSADSRHNFRARARPKRSSKRRQLRPQRLAEPAVAPARPVAAQPGLQDHHGSPALTQLPRRPQAGVAAADDHDVGALLALQGRRRFDRAGLGQPVAVGGVDHRPT